MALPFLRSFHVSLANDGVSTLIVQVDASHADHTDSYA